MSNTTAHVQLDWQQREFIEDITNNIKKVVEFINRFGTPLVHVPSSLCGQKPACVEFGPFICLTHLDKSTRYRLAVINGKLTALERKVDYIENALRSVSEGQASAQTEAAE